MIDKNGKVVKTVMRSFSMNEISAVDRPAQVHATVSIMKRDAAELQKLEVSMALTTMAGGHSHLITMGGGEYYRRAGSTDYSDGHSHPWLMDEAGNIVVGFALGHNHGIEVLSKGEMSLDSLKRLLSKEGAPASEDSNSTQVTTNTAAEAIGENHEEAIMTPEEKKAAEAAAAAQKAEMEKLAKRAERAEAINSLSDAHRTYFKSLKGADADAFLGQSENDRNEVIRKAQEANQVVYTAEDGTEYRKSDDVRLVNMAKAMDAEKKKRKEMEAAACKADLEKRAGELAHIPGTIEDRVALLKGIDMLPAAERERATAALKAQNERLGKSFQSIGTSAAPAPDSNLDPLDNLAAEIAKRDKITFEQAYTKALNTPEGQKLYEAHVNKRHGVVV